MKEKTICRGDLFYYDFGTRTGSVQSGTRPVRVIQADDYNRSAPMRVCIMIGIMPLHLPYICLMTV